MPGETYILMFFVILPCLPFLRSSRQWYLWQGWSKGPPS